MWPGISTGVISTPPNEIGSPSATTTSRRGGGKPAAGGAAGARRARGRVLDEVPVGRRQRDARTALLEVRGAAEVIRVAVPDEHVAHVVRVEPDCAQLRQEHGLELVGIAGVDQQNAVRRRQRPDDGARAAERVQVVEHARGSDLRVVGAVGAARVAAEELDGFTPFAARGGARPIDDGRYGGRIGSGRVQVAEPGPLRRWRARSRAAMCRSVESWLPPVATRPQFGMDGKSHAPIPGIGTCDFRQRPSRR